MIKETFNIKPQTWEEVPTTKLISHSLRRQPSLFIDAMTKNTPAGKRVDFSTRQSFFLGMTVWRGEQKEKNKMNGAKENRRNNFPQYN